MPLSRQRVIGLGSQKIALLAPTTITTAVGPVVTTAVTDLTDIIVLTVQATFTYGSGGTTAKCYIETSFDAGVTWVDVMCFAFTTASLRVLSSVRAFTAVAANYTATAAALADNTIKDGLLGDQLRVSYTTTGTYAGGTTIRLDAVTKAA